MVENPRFPHQCKISRLGETTAMQDEAESAVVYEGACRSYSESRVTASGVVLTSYRKLALPVKQTEWTEATIPLEGDMVEVTRTGYTERGTVVDKLPNNFGTDILWTYNRD